MATTNENAHINQDIVYFILQGQSGFPGQAGSQGNRVSTHTHTHTHIYIYIIFPCVRTVIYDG